MDKHNWQKQLHRVITDEIEAASELREALGSEHHALAQDPEAIEHAAAEKQHQLERLEALEAERIALLASAGYGSEPDPMSACLAVCDQNALLRRAWDELLGLIEECRRTNLRNGMIVGAARQAVGQALAVLHGEEPDPGTYGASGHTAGVKLSRTLAKA